MGAIDVALSRVAKVAVSTAAVLFATKVARTAKKVAAEAASVFKSMRDFANAIKKKMGEAMWRIPFIMIVWFVLRKAGVNSRLMDLGLGVAMASLLGKGFWKHVFKFFRDEDVAEEKPVPQFQAGLSNTVAGLLTVVVTMSALGRKFDKRSVTGLSKRVSNFDKMNVGFESFVNWIFTNIEALVNHIRAMFHKDKIKIFKKHQNATEKWLSEVDALVCDHNTAKVTADAE